MSLLGIEIGTHSAVAAAYDLEGRLLGRGESDYAPEHPRTGWSEIDVETVWQGLRRAAGEAAAKSDDPVTALALAVPGEALLPVDRGGNPLALSIMPFDTRADGVVLDLRERFSPFELMRVTGIPLSSACALSRLIWFKTQQPSVYERTWKFMSWQDYFLHRLGLEPAIDASLAGRTMMFDVVNRRWAESLIDQVGLDRAMLSDVRPAGTHLGEITRKAAEELGLPHGVKVVLGGYDQAVGALGVGAIDTGHTMDATGIVECLVPVMHEPALDAHMLHNGFSCSPHVVSEMCVSLAWNFTGGALLRWYRDTLGVDEKQVAEKEGRDVYDVIMDLMDDEPTTLLVLPYFAASGTPYFEPRAMGSILGLDLTTQRRTIIRALLEGVTFEMKLSAQLLAESGIRVDVVHATGGAARSRKWCQLKADVFGLKVYRHVEVDAPALGAAMLAGMGTGSYKDAAEAVAFCVRPDEKIDPDGTRADIYGKKFARYRKLYPALRDIL